MGGRALGRRYSAPRSLTGLRKDILQSDKTALAFCYFNVDDQNKRSFTACLCSLLVQLMENTSDSVPRALKELRKNSAGSLLPTLPDLIMTFQSLLSSEKRRYFLLLDALGECQHEDELELFGMLRNLSCAENIDISIILTSRVRTKEKYEEQLQNQEQDWIGSTFVGITIGGLETGADTRKHIAYRLENDEKLKVWDTKDRELISKKLLEKADGM